MSLDELIEAKPEIKFSSQLKATFETQLKAIWLHWYPQPRPCFNLELLHSLQEHGEFISQNRGKFLYKNQEYPIKYIISVSDIPNVFNLGGDLELFIRLIQEQDKLGLLKYGQICIEVLYKNYIAYGLPLTTVSLVQGLCLGGGFEAALSSDILIAERGARFGFPEIAFNLFPGMGAYSFLSRRLGQRLADEFVSSGKRYTADELFDLGLVHAVVKDGEGKNAVRELITKRDRSRNGLEGLAQVRRSTQKIEYQELLTVVEIWVEHALNLTNKDLRLMARFMKGQSLFGMKTAFAS